MIEPTTAKSVRVKRADFPFRAEDYVVAAGELISFEAEIDDDPREIDHFWITIRAGDFGPLQISINTYSLRHAADGFDPRMRVAVVPSAWTNLPRSGVFPAAGLDYAKLETQPLAGFREMERPALEELLTDKLKRTIFVEGWGSLYLRGRLGLHQVHSRRASCSMPTDRVGRDGAIRLYYSENSAAEMILFKYCGQV